MILYNVSVRGVTPTAGNDIMTLISNATRSFGVLEIDLEGDGVASAYTEHGLYRVGTVGVTGGGAVVPAPVNSASPAFGGTVNTTWGTQPVVGALVQALPLNANGQRYFWRCMPNLGDAIWSPGGGGTVPAGQLSLRAVTVSGPMSARLKLAEI